MLNFSCLDLFVTARKLHLNVYGAMNRFKFLTALLSKKCRAANSFLEAYHKYNSKKAIRVLIGFSA